MCPHAVPGPCDPEDLIDGIIFAATYLGCTHLLSERTPTKSARMQQAQEAMNRVRVSQADLLAAGLEEKHVTCRGPTRLTAQTRVESHVFCFTFSKLKTQLWTDFFILN